MARGAVAFVEADRLDLGVVDRRELQSELVLDVAAVARAVVGLGG